MHSQLAVRAAIQAAFHAPPVERLLTDQSNIQTGENRERPHFLGDVTREVSPVSNYQRPKWHQMRYTHTHRDNKNSLPCSRAHQKSLWEPTLFWGEERKIVFFATWKRRQNIADAIYRHVVFTPRLENLF
jgi:hypothetical protein